MDNRLYLFKGRNGKWGTQDRRKSSPCVQSKPEDDYLRYIYECKPCCVILTDVMQFSESDLTTGKRNVLQAGKGFQDKSDKISKSKTTSSQEKSSVINKRFTLKKRLNTSFIKTCTKNEYLYKLASSYNSLKSIFLKRHNRINRRKGLSYVKAYPIRRRLSSRPESEMAKNNPVLTEERVFDQPYIKNTMNLVDKRSVNAENQSNECDLGFKETANPLTKTDIPHTTFYSLLKENSDITGHEIFCDLNCANFSLSGESDITIQHSEPLNEYRFSCANKNCATKNSLSRIRDFEALKKVGESYCCCYCYISKDSLVSINEHIEQTHNTIVLFTCLLCDKTIHGYQQGLIPHFELEHPNQMIQYRQVSDFYNIRNATIKPQEERNTFIHNENSQQICNKVSFSDIDKVVSTEADSTVTEDELHQRNNYNYITNNKEELIPTDKEQKQEGIVISENTLDKNTPNEEIQKGDKWDNPIHNAQHELTDEAEFTNALGIRIVDVMSLHPETNNDDTLWQGSDYQSILSKQPNEKISNSVHKTDCLDKRNDTQIIYERSQFISNKCSSSSCTYSACNGDPLLLSRMTDFLHVTQIEIKHLFDCSLCYKRSLNATNHWNEGNPGFRESAEPLMTKDVPHKTFYSLLKASKKRLRLLEVHVGDIHISNEKYASETAIYICSRCKENMPALFFIDDHLNSKHKDLFVSLNSKMDQLKESETVRNVIDDVHLCLAIDTNLYNAVQNTIQEKMTQNELKKKLNFHLPKSKESRDGTTIKQLIEKNNGVGSSQLNEKCINSEKTSDNISYIKNVAEVTQSPINSQNPSLYQVEQCHKKTDSAPATATKSMPVTGKSEFNSRILKTQQFTAVSSSCNIHAVNNETKIQFPDDDVIIVEESCTDNKSICNSVRKSPLVPSRQQEGFVIPMNLRKEYVNHINNDVVYQGTSVDNKRLYSGYTVQPIRPVVNQQHPAATNSYKTDNAKYQSISKNGNYHVQTKQCSQNLYPGIKYSGIGQHYCRNVFPLDTRVDVKNDHRLKTKLVTNNESYHQGVKHNSLIPFQNNYNENVNNQRSEKSAQSTTMHTHLLGHQTQFPLSTSQYNVFNARTRETNDCSTTKTDEIKHGFPSCNMLRDQHICNGNERGNYFQLPRRTSSAIIDELYSKNSSLPTLPYGNYQTYPPRTLYQQTYIDGHMFRNQRFIRRYPLNNPYQNQLRRQRVISAQKCCQLSSPTLSSFENQTLFPDNMHRHCMSHQFGNIKEHRQSTSSNLRDCDRLQSDCLSHMEIQTSSLEYSDDTSPEKYQMFKLSPVGQNRRCEKMPYFL
ncbi:uncharacterized protein LOC134707823 [Mytilus trossulus]|uniref:uncharacterized protein LOC134707823 n=1 Tax=Mytilus trossulus TaxID=6551 RepID=UPI0030072EB2